MLDRLSESNVPKPSSITRKLGCGRLDGYFHNKINLWDIAAGKIIVEEAGGKINIIKGFKSEKLDIRGGNPNIYEKMIKKLAKF